MNQNKTIPRRKTGRAFWRELKNQNNTEKNGKRISDMDLQGAIKERAGWYNLAGDKQIEDLI